MNKRRLLSILLAICMMVSMMPTVAFAEGELPVQIEVKNSQNGNTQYKINDGSWIDLNESKTWNVDGVTNGDTIFVRAIVNEGQELDTFATQFYVDEKQETIECDALQTESGWSFTYTEGKSYQVCVEYRNGGNAESESPVQIEVKNSQNGNTQYKINDGSWIDLNESKTWNVDGVTNGDTIFVRAIVNEGQELDTFGSQFFVDGKQETIECDALQTESGWNFTYTEGKSYQVCVEYRNGGNPSDPSNPSDPVGPVEPADPVNPGEFRFSCQSEAVSGGSIYYKLNNTGDFLQVSEENNQYNSITLTDTDTTIAIKIVANEDYQLDTVRGVAFRVDGKDKFNSTDENIAEFTTDGGYTFNLSELVGTGSVSTSCFELEFGFGGKNDNPGPGPEPDPPHSGYEGDMVSAELTITGDIDFYINDSHMINIAGGNNESQSVDYTYDSATNTVDFYICCFINMRYTSFEVNGTNYINQLPTPDTDKGKEDLLEACKGQINEFKITVPYSADGYTIVAAQKALDDTDAGYMVVGNFLWTYSEENSQSDDYLDHGRMELLKVTYKGAEYNPGSDTDMGWSQSESGGSAVLPVGSVVTVKLVPEYGYQLTSFGINGGDFGVGEEQSTFTFEIKPGNFHLGAHFTQVEDKVSSTADIVSAGDIQLGTNEIDTGSVVLFVGNATGNVSEDGFKNAIEQNEGTGGYKIASVLDINLNQVIYKGTEDAYWSNPKSNLNSPAKISLKLDGDYLNPVVIHEKHDGSFEVIQTAYNSIDGTITFETDSFSNYAVAVAPVWEESPSIEHTHSYGTEWRYDDGYHWKKCSCGDKAEIAVHTASDWIIDSAATATTEGTKHKECTVCGYVMETVTIPVTEPVEPPHTHSYGTEWRYDDGYHWKECSCGDKTEIVAHTASDWIIDSAATATTEGTKHKECTVCKKILSTTVIPKVSTAKLSKVSYTYDGKTKTPSVTVKDSTGKTLVNNTDYEINYASGRKNVGTYKVTIEFKGKYTGTVTKSFKINPKSTTISGVTAESKGFTVMWKKNTAQTMGYQIQYSTNSKFESVKTVTVSDNKTTKKTISKLKAKKKYYIRIRTYKKIGSAKYYSSWSKAKTVTTKE